MYATHYDHRSVSAIDLSSFLVKPITLSDSPLGVSMTPDGLQAYVASRCSLSVIDTVVNEAARIAVGEVADIGWPPASMVSVTHWAMVSMTDPEALAVSPDGHRLYVGDYWSGTVTMLPVQP